MGCISQSCVDVASKEIKKQRAPELTHHDHNLRRKGKMKADNGTTRRNIKAALECHKVRISERVNFLMMRCNTLSLQLFEREENEEMDKEMEIGHPTDVKHVTHIGFDGSTTLNPVIGWENLKVPELLSSISLKQFEIAMSGQARGPPDVDNTAKFAL